MKTAIIGTGGVGGYFGGRLAQAGFDVTFIARGKHFEALKSDGLKVKSINGDFQIHPVKCVDQISDLGHPDLIILGIKAWQIKDVAKELKSVIHNATTILPLQNGIMSAEELSAGLGAEHVLGGLCRIFSKIEAPGIIDHFGAEPSIVFGEMNNRITERTRKIQSMFDKAGIRARISEDITADIWKKFIPICTSGLLALIRSSYGQVCEVEESFQLMTELIYEIFNLSQKMNIRIDEDFPEKTLNAIRTFPYETSASLSRDIWEGKPSELDYQNGTVVRLAEKYGMSVPVNRFIYYCLLPQELRARKQS